MFTARPRNDTVVEVGSSRSINAVETTDSVLSTFEEQIVYPHEESNLKFLFVV
jgi:hypothetical protein